jgi:hypothetical protein
MAQSQHTSSLSSLEAALTALFCLIDDAYTTLNPQGAYRYETLKHLSDSEVITPRSFSTTPRGGERSLLRECERFFSELFPAVVGLYPSSLNRGVRKLRRFLEPVRRAVLFELVGETETLLIDSTLLCVLHPRQVNQSAGITDAARLRWGSSSVYVL